MAIHTILFTYIMGSEVRQFSHSRFINNLIEAGSHIVVTTKVNDDDLRIQLECCAEFRLLPSTPRPLVLEQIEIILDKAHLMREACQGKKGWQYQVSQSKKYKQKVLFALQNICAQVSSRFYPVYGLFLFFERLLQRLFVSGEWVALLQETSPSIVITNVPKVNRILPGLAAAKAAGCETVVLYHTWKDISAAGRLNHDFSLIGVWNEEMKAELLRQNPQVDPETVKIVGCAHFDCVGRKDWLQTEADFRLSIGVRPHSWLVLYTAAAPWVVPEEERYIALLWSAINQGAFGEDTQLLVRLNPMDDTNRLASALQAISPDIIVNRPDWRWDKKANWCFQRKSDLLFYNSLLEYSAVCVGMPSTVTVECAVANLPVINIGFEMPGPSPLNGSIRAFWDADFYRDVRESGAAALAASPEELLVLMNRALQDRNWLKPQREQLLKKQLGVPPHHSVDAMMELVDQLLSERAASKKNVE